MARVVVYAAWLGGSFGAALYVSTDALAYTPAFINDELTYAVLATLVFLSLSYPMVAVLARVVDRRYYAARLATLAPGQGPGSTSCRPLTARQTHLLESCRLTMSLVGDCRDDSMVSRAIWDWLEQLADLPPEEREPLLAAGLGEGSLRELAFGDAYRPHVRTALGIQQRRRSQHELARFERALVDPEPETKPYR